MSSYFVQATISRNNRQLPFRVTQPRIGQEYLSQTHEGAHDADYEPLGLPGK